MKKDEFHIGQEFYTATGKWRCTDIGTRVIVAIELNQDDTRNYTGPPYSIPEHVFDEYDMKGCRLDPFDLEIRKQAVTKSQKFMDIENALMFVSSAEYGANSALLDKSTGEIYYRSEYGDIDEMEDLPEDEDDPEIHIHIPHKNDLDLGRNLVFEFTQRFIPDAYERIEKIFRKRGAYSKFKDLLLSRGMLQEWYDFENEREHLALTRWCEENNIDIND